MELEAKLRAFAAVARHASFSRAADELAITQPAVSKHVAALEAAVEAKLVVRHARGARLTPAGEFLAGYVSRAEALLAQATSGIDAIVHVESGRVSIAASGTPGLYILPRVLAAFGDARPNIELAVEVSTSARVADAVRAHRVDLGLVGGHAAASDLQSEPLLEDELVIVGPSSMGGRTVSTRELDGTTWLSREEGSATREATELAWQSVGITPHRRLELPSWEMIKGAVASGAGVAVISRLAIELELDGGALSVLHVPGWHVVRPLSVIHSRDVPLAPPAEMFLAILRETTNGMKLEPEQRPYLRTRCTSTPGRAGNGRTTSEHGSSASRGTSIRTGMLPTSPAGAADHRRRR